MGCGASANDIAVAASIDGGLHFGKPVVLPHSSGARDPSIAVAPSGAVYAAFISATAHNTFPAVVASFDHGKTFPRYRALVPRQRDNWGDRVFLAVGRTGTLYLTWDYGPSNSAVTYICSSSGSCGFATGDLNVVSQKSTDAGRTWGPITHISPGFPASGGDSAPLLVGPNGQIYAEYQGYRVTSPTKYTLAPAHSYFTSSANGGKSWSPPVRIGPVTLAMSLGEWWIDGDIAADSAQNLYVTWDTQTVRQDTGWLSYSSDRGRHWSKLWRVTPDTDNATHIVQVVGGPRGIAYVAWLADNSRLGYALYLRAFSIQKGWLSAPIRVSRSTYGSRAVWPGDTIGISALPGHRVVVSWGSAVGGSQANSEIRAAVVTF
jgi:hypothetical protein